MYYYDKMFFIKQNFDIHTFSITLLWFKMVVLFFKIVIDFDTTFSSTCLIRKL